jgi:hypothetical protein
MTPRTPQCEVFWSFNSSSEFLGVPEDSKFPLLGVWASPSHLAQSGVATHYLHQGNANALNYFHYWKLILFHYAFHPTNGGNFKSIIVEIKFALIMIIKKQVAWQEFHSLIHSTTHLMVV